MLETKKSCSKYEKLAKKKLVESSNPLALTVLELSTSQRRGVGGGGGVGAQKFPWV